MKQAKTPREEVQSDETGRLMSPAAKPPSQVPLAQPVQSGPLARVPTMVEPYTVFLCHVSSHAELVGKIATALPETGLQPFVAPRSVPASTEWLAAVEQALRTCDALIAFLSDDFRASPWTDQEIGYVLGRARPVVPVRLASGHRPHGFISRLQDVNAATMSPVGIADTLFDCLLRVSTEQARLSAVVVDHLGRERSHERLKVWVRRLEAIGDLSDQHVAALKDVAERNTVLRADKSMIRAVNEFLRSRVA